MTRVGLMGIGRMGGAMARALAAAGFPLVLYNRSADRARDLAAELGASVAGTPAELSRAVDVAISMVADDDAVRALYAGPDGLVAGLGPGTVAIDMSTVLPTTVQELAGPVRATGAGILDAPVSGSVALAERGELTIMVGGDVADLERARPVLDALAGRIFHLGPLGMGATMKLAVNAVIFGLNQALSEALVLAESAGVERALAYDVLAASAVGAPFVGYKRAAFLEPGATPTAFALALAEKDLTLITGLADQLGLHLPQAGTNLEAIRAAEADVGREADFSAVAEHLRTVRTG